jgi:hypothetical protein
MEDFEKGALLRTMEVSDPRARGKRIYLRAAIMGSAAILIIMIVLELWIGAFSIEMIAFLALLFAVMEIFTVLVLLATIGRSLKPIKFYSGGIEFSEFAFDRLLGMKPFVQRVDITEASVGGMNGSTIVSGFTVRTMQGKKYYSGDRTEQDTRSALEFMRAEWGIKLTGVTGSTARKIMVKATVAQPSSPGFCPGCGARMSSDYAFCPRCGHGKA